MVRKQFTFYSSFFKSIQLLPTNKEKLQAYEAICEYALNGEKPPAEALKPSVATIFAIAQPILDAASEKAASAIKKKSAKKAKSQQAIS